MPLVTANRFNMRLIDGKRLVQLCFDLNPDGFDASAFDTLADQVSDFWLGNFKEAIFTTAISSHYDDYITFWADVGHRSAALAGQRGEELHKVWTNVIIQGAKEGLLAKEYWFFVQATLGEFTRQLVPKKPNLAGKRDIYLAFGAAAKEVSDVCRPAGFSPRMN